MKVIVAILLSISLYSCEDIIIDSNKLINSVAVNRLQGNFQGCSPSVDYPGYFQKSHIYFEGLNYFSEQSTHWQADCSDVSGVSISKMQIVNAKVSDTDPSVIEVDLKHISTSFRPDHPWYLSQNYCGHTDWVLSVDRDITGQYCPTYTIDPSGYIESYGDMFYTTFKITSTQIGFASTGTEFGKTPEDRVVSNIFYVDKI